LSTAGSVAERGARRSVGPSGLGYDLTIVPPSGGPNTFGVFRLKIAGGSCTTAHRVAKTWMRRFEADLRNGRVKLPRHVRGFAFDTLRATEAQSYRERGRKGAKTIRFLYRVPNG
jgi:hypothetical protein